MRVRLDGFPYDIAGTLDVEEACGARDTKTSGKSLNRSELTRSVQMDTYEFLFARKNGRRAKLRKLDVLTTAKTPKTYTMVARATTSDDAILRRIEYATRVLETGAFYPVDPTGPSGWVCSHRWCGYYDNICPFGRKAKVQV